MAVLWIIGILLALFVLLLLLPVGARASFGDETRLALRIGLLTVPILPRREKKKRLPKKKEKAQARSPEKRRPFKPTFDEIRSGVPALWAALKKALCRTRRAVRIDPVRLSVTFAGDDPVRVAQMYGWAEGVMWTFMPRLEELVRMPDPRIHLDVDYQQTKSRVAGEIGFSLRAAHGLVIVLTLAIPLLRWYLAVRKNGRASEQTIKEQSNAKENEHGKE